MNRASFDALCRRLAGPVMVLLLFAGCPPVAQADAAAVPIKDFVRDAEFLSARISPTGEYLAVAMPIEGQTMVGILDLKSKKVAGHLRFAKGEHVAEFEWVSPQRIVASVATSYGPLE